MNWTKFKSLSLREKLQWIFQYYGLTIAVVAAALFVGGVFLYSVLGPGDGSVIHVLILDDHQSADVCRAFSEDLSALLGGECDVTSYTESNANQMQAFVIRLMTDELDLIIAPKAQMDELLENEYLRSSTELPEGALYYTYTGGGSAQDGSIFCIGETARSKSRHNAAAIDYFSGKAN